MGSGDELDLSDEALELTPEEREEVEAALARVDDIIIRAFSIGQQHKTADEVLRARHDLFADVLKMISENPLAAPELAEGALMALRIDGEAPPT